MKKATIIAFISAIAIITAGFIYFVSGVSSVSPPLKKYKYLGDINQFVSGINNYASKDSNVIVKITDTVGDLKNDYAYYLTIKVKKKHTVTYRLMCEPDNGNRIIKTNVNLILAYDETNETGGYDIKGIGVKELIKEFDYNVLKLLRENENIKVTPL